jgi:hypothetical protein
MPTTTKRILPGLALAGTMMIACCQIKADQATVNLNTAATFAVLADSQVTGAGISTVVGDIGSYSGVAVSGFPPGTLSGTIHAGDPVAAQGQADLSTAYNDAAGRPLPTTLSGNIGGTTLYPGLYNSTSSLAISSGDLTLDAQGDTNAVFIFQIASTLTTTSGRQVILAGGAQANNIFWQVGSSATLGTTSTFQGTIMAAISISIETGATLTGRALAESGEVTLDGNTITDPTPIAAPPSFGGISLATNGSGSVTLLITNTPGRILTIQFSTNLTSWTTLANPTPNENPYTFVDNSAAPDAARYYRAFYP